MCEKNYNEQFSTFADALWWGVVSDHYQKYQCICGNHDFSFFKNRLLCAQLGTATVCRRHGAEKL